MIAFDPENLFPSRAAESLVLSENQAHALLVDAWLGFETHAIERDLSERDKTAGKALENADAGIPQQAWIGLAVAALLTPYVEIRAILDLLGLKAGDQIVDLGAAYGRMAFVLEEHFPGVSYIGFELIPERVREANRIFALAGLRARMQEADLTAEGLVLADASHYFIYDYGSRKAIDKTLRDIQAIAARHPITLIGRGGATRDAIEKHHPWLTQIVRPRHFKTFSIYKSAEVPGLFR